MVCPVCPVVAATGGGIAGFFGIDRPDLQVASTVITTVLTVTTTVALKFFLNISICDGNGDFSPRNILQVGLISFVIGTIYSVAVNFLLDCMFPLPQEEILECEPTSNSPCCCNKKNQ